MNRTPSTTRDLIAALGRCSAQGPDVVVCPPFVCLAAALDAAAGTGIQVGAQDVFWKDSGAYTGQVAPDMLTDMGVSHVILGHSERRGRFGVPEPDFTPATLAHFGESDETVNRKLHAALRHGLIPIVCCGETLVERTAGATDAVVAGQIEAGLARLTATQCAGIVLAYEPVWAIGTGETCAAEEADRVCGVIRATVTSLFGAGAGEAVRIQYGGSVKPDNAADLLGRPHIDGALVGGASLKAADFLAIVAAAAGS